MLRSSSTKNIYLRREKMKRTIALVLSVLMLAALFSGCGSTQAPAAAPAAEAPAAEAPAAEAPAAEAPAAEAPAAAATFADLGVTYLNSDGKIIMENAPESYGIATASGADLEKLFTPEVIQTIKDGNFTAVYCGHEDGSLWAQTLIKSFGATLEKFGAKLITSTGSYWSLDDQISKIESCIEMDPDLMVIYIMDEDAYADVLKKASDKGIYLIGLNGMPNNRENYPTYLGTIVPDFYMLGYYSMDMICKQVQSGQIGVSTIINYGEDSNTRLQGALDAAATYPDIEVVKGADIAMTVESATEIGESMIMAYPDLKGYWATWDALAMGAGSGIASLGKSVKVSGPDISDTSSIISMYTDGMFVGTAAISPNDEGTLLAMIGVLGMAGVEAPEMILSPVVIYDKDTAVQAWQYSFGEELDPDVVALIG